MKKAISSQSSLKTYDVCLQPHSLISWALFVIKTSKFSLINLIW
jgi:hypothetical protein